MSPPERGERGGPGRLALEGGKPVREKLLPYGRQWIDEDDIARVVEVLRSDWITTGPQVARFEEAFAAKVGARHAVAVSSGTAALHTAVHAAGIAPGDEVIVPALTFAATANCARFQGATVVFADVRPDTLTLDPADVERRLTPRTRAIITVDYAGQPSDLADLLSLAEGRNLTLIDDACHALGASCSGSPVGSQAPFTAFSLHPVKAITTGEGGVVTTDMEDRAALMRRFRNHGLNVEARERESRGAWQYEMVELGWNYRLTDLQCALGLSQLRKLEGWTARRREIARRYSEALAGVPGAEVPTVLPDRESAWHLYVLRLDLPRLRVGREEVFRALRAEGIGVNVHYLPVPWHPYYRELGYRRGGWPVAEAAYEQMVSLPLFPAMSDRDAEDVVEAVRKVLLAYRR